MNIDEWKALAERHAGRKLKWTDRKDPWDGLTAGAEDDNSLIYSIMPKQNPPAVIINGNKTTPLDAVMEVQCQPEPVPTVTEPERAHTATKVVRPVPSTNVPIAKARRPVRTAMAQAAFL